MFQDHGGIKFEDDSERGHDEWIGMSLGVGDPIQMCRIIAALYGEIGLCITTSIFIFGNPTLQGSNKVGGADMLNGWGRQWNCQLQHAWFPCKSEKLQDVSKVEGNLNDGMVSSLHSVPWKSIVGESRPWRDRMRRRYRARPRWMNRNVSWRRRSNTNAPCNCSPIRREGER